MTLSTTWVVIIIVVGIAIIISSITTLMKSNKPFDFPDGYENPDPYEKDTNKNEIDDKKKPS